MAQLDPLGIMDADLDSCVPTDIITSSDKLGEELRPLLGSRLLKAVSFWSEGRFLFLCTKLVPGTSRRSHTCDKICTSVFFLNLTSPSNTSILTLTIVSSS